MEVKSDGVDEEMNDDVDSVRGLLDRLKQEKERELLQQTGSSSVPENGITILDSKQNDLINELQKKQTSQVMNLKSVVKPEDSPQSSSGDATVTQSDTGDNSKKRKQNSFLVEVQERAEVISKSARKGPETVLSSMGQNVEEDPDTEQFLKMIRAVPSTLIEVQVSTEHIETRVHRSKSASEVDLSVVVRVSSELNLEPQKSKIPLVRSGSLKGRRKPTAAARRKSVKSGFMDWNDAGVISEGDESMDEDETGIGSSGGSFIIKDPPKAGAGSAVRLRTRPKVKSQTVAGIALPGLAEILSKKNIINKTKQDNVRPQVSAAEMVRAAAEGKKNQAAKEEKVEKEPEKPAWLVEAEARRKLHQQRRQNKVKQHEGMDKDQPAEDKPLNSVVLRPVAPRSEPVVSNSDSNKSEPGVGKPEGNGAKVLHNVMLRPVRKPEPAPTKSEDDNNVGRAALNICLRPVSKPGPFATENEGDKNSDSVKPHNVFLRPIPKPEPSKPGTENEEDKDSDSVKTRNVFLRPMPKPEPAINNISEDVPDRLQHVRLKPIVHSMEPKPSDSKVADSETSHMAIQTSEVVISSKPIYPLEMRSSGSTGAETEATSMAIGTSSEVTSSSAPVKPVTQTTTPSHVHENGETPATGVTGLAKSPPEYHIIRSLAPITSEIPAVTRSEPKVAEAFSSHTSRLKGGSRVTVSSNFVSVPHKVAPKTKPKPTNRSKTVTVTASEVPDLSTARRTSVELIRARPVSTIIAASIAGHAFSHGDMRIPQKGAESRDRSDTYNMAYKLRYTGDMLPQWKIDLAEKKKNVATKPDRPQPSYSSNSVVVPKWKKELAEKRKQRVEVTSPLTSNKENEHKSSPEIPQWKKEIAERRKRREPSPIRIQPNNYIDRPPETPEWKQRLPKTRRAQHKQIVIPRGPSEDPSDQVPSFMKEFEKKKRTFPRELLPKVVEAAFEHNDD